MRDGGNTLDKVAKIFSAAPTKPKQPKLVVEKPPVMPTPDDNAVKAAKRRALLARQAQSSRASTDLFDKEVLGAA